MCRKPTRQNLILSQGIFFHILLEDTLLVIICFTRYHEDIKTLYAFNVFH